MKKNYDVIIIGAGPAGIFSAIELVKQGIKDILMIDKGKSVKERLPTETLFGVGGAGLFSDGKLNFTPILGKTNLTEFVPLGEANKIILDIEKIFQDFGVKEKTYPTDIKKAKEYQRIAKKVGVELYLVKQKHLGSDRLRKHVAKMEDFLRNKGVTFLLENSVEKILAKKGKVVGVKLSSGKTIFAQNIIAAPGRAGNPWLSQELSLLGIETEQLSFEIGVRVEIPTEIMEEITSVIYDPTIFVRTPSYDDLVRTFCTNPSGFVVQEKYKSFVCVNGHANKNHFSSNSNFALLDKVNLTEPVTDTIAYGESICRLANTIGGGKPILQRLADFKRFRRSTWRRLSKSYIEPTLKDVTPGDISMAFPHRIVVNIIEALERLDKIIPGVASDSTLLYAPEAKFFSVRPKIDKNLQTEIRGLFVAGDGAGISGNIVGAAATGIIAARGIVNGGN